MPSRRAFLFLTASALGAPYLARPAVAARAGRPLPIPDLVDASGGRTELSAIAGQAHMVAGAATPVLGFSRAYLGPTLRLRRGENHALRVHNRLDQPITCHWHGMRVAAVLDGGPSLPIAPGDSWSVSLPVAQPAATLWYHSHVHRVTAEQVYHGLAGLILIDDPEAGDEGLPSRYGIDDLPLIIQDRAFDQNGQLYYLKRGPALTHGFLADKILVNGAIRPDAKVPAGLVRLRLLNGSNARIYDLRFSDSRAFHQVASDSGLLQGPVRRDAIVLAPGERAEIVVDFTDAAPVTLLSRRHDNRPLSGGMIREMSHLLPGPPPQSEFGEAGAFDVMRFLPDPARPGLVAALPERFASAASAPAVEPVRRRVITLDMFTQGSGTGPGTQTGGSLHKIMFMGMNNTPFDHAVINQRLGLAEPELWTIRTSVMAHPFHLHGASFQVLRQNGEAVDFASHGMKDVTLVRGETDILFVPMHPAGDPVPYMYHCHILEHEDAGMMGQFVVT